jgi:hypothetical protein
VKRRLRLLVLVALAGAACGDEAVGYQQAGSFVEFPVEAEGFGPLRELLCRGAREDDLGAIRAAFVHSFRCTLAEAERRWRGFPGEPA